MPSIPLDPQDADTKEEKKQAILEIKALSFSPDDNIIATAGEDGKVRLWGMDGKLLRTLFESDNEKTDRYRYAHSYEGSVSFSPDGTTIALANRTNTIQFWKRDGTLLDTLDVPRSSIVKYSPDGKLLATDGSIDYPFNDDVATLFKQDGTIIATLTDDSGDRFNDITDISFSPDGKIIATARSYDDQIELWDLDGNLLHTFKGHQKSIKSVSFSPDGKTLLSASGLGGIVKLWKLDGTLIKSFVGDDIRIEDAEFSPDGKMIATSGDGQVKLWTSDGEGLLEYRRESRKSPGNLAFSPNSELLAIAYKDGRVEIKHLGLNDLVKPDCNRIEYYLSTHPEQQRELKICQDTILLQPN